MKIVLFLVFLATLLNANEIQRIESIVSDITKLRNDYSKLEDKLIITEFKLKDEEEKNRILLKKEKSSINRINSLEGQIELLENKRKTKVVEKIVIQTKTEECVINQTIDDANPFPKLQMKKKFSKRKDESVYVKASAFRVNKEAFIYAGVDGAVIEKWEDRTSFTSNEKQGKWVKITGYFVNKIWKPSEKNMWIKSCDVINRDKVSQ